MLIQKRLVSTFISFFPLFLAACAQGPIRLEPGTNEELANPESTWVALAYDINTPGCELRVSHLAEDVEYDMPLDPEQNEVWFEVPQGAIRGVQISCPSFRKWSLSRFLKKEVELSPSKINYLGQVSFLLDRTGKDIKLGFGDRAKDMNGAGQVIQRLPEAARKRLVSAATTKNIREPMTRTGSNWSPNLKIGVKRFVQTSDNKTPQSQGDPLVQELKNQLTTCDQEEQKNYPMRIGRIQWTAYYEATKLTKLDKQLNEHSFSDEWVRCNEEALSKMSPPANERLEVSLEL